MLQAKFLQAIGIPIWHTKPRNSKNVHIVPYLLDSRCVVLLPLSKNYSNLHRSKIKTLTNKMLQVLSIPTQQLVVISIYMDQIDALIGDPERHIIQDYLHHSNSKHILSFLSASSNTAINIKNINLTEILHPEIIIQQPEHKAVIYEKLLGVRKKCC